MLTKLFGKPTKDEFAETICELAQSHGDFELTYDQERFRIVVGDPEEFTNQFNLGNVYEEYVAAGPLRRRTLLKGYVSMLVDSPTEKIPDTFREAQPGLVPRVRERSYHSIAKLQMEAEGEEYFEPAYRILADHLLVELVYDLPESIATIGKIPLEEWGVGLDMALDVASRNLADHSDNGFDSPQPGVYVSAWHDNHDASRLVLIGFIRSLDVKGDHVAMVPHRDVLVVTGSEDVDGLAKMAELAEAAASDTRFMTAIPVRLQWDQWVPFRLPEGHSLHSRFELLRYQSITRDYEEQQTLLDQLHERNDEDVFVASYTATQNQETGKVSSYCVWSKDVLTLLPEADRVHFYDDALPGDDKIAASASWGRVLEIVGGMMGKQETCPPRYLVDEFPNREELEELVRSD